MNTHSSFILIAKNQIQPKCPSTSEQYKKLWYVHTMKYYLVTKKNPNYCYKQQIQTPKASERTQKATNE